jgi:hypothetical protein
MDFFKPPIGIFSNETTPTSAEIHRDDVFAMKRS